MCCYNSLVKEDSFGRTMHPKNLVIIVSKHSGSFEGQAEFPRRLEIMKL